MRSDLKKLIYSAAYGVHRRYHHWVDTEDLRQQMWLWVSSQRAAKLDELTPGTLTRRLWDVGLDYARNEKAIRSGYSSEDEYFYSTSTIRDLLPWVIDPELPVFRGVDDRQVTSAVRAAAGPSMELETMVIDLRKVYAKELRLEEQKVLNMYVMGTLDDGESVKSVIRRIQRALGGRRPQREAA
jgi:hypothetical protein